LKALPEYRYMQLSFRITLGKVQKRPEVPLILLRTCDRGPRDRAASQRNEVSPPHATRSTMMTVRRISDDLMLGAESTLGAIESSG
jgi:hypothetical protein